MRETAKKPGDSILFLLQPQKGVSCKMMGKTLFCKYLQVLVSFALIFELAAKPIEQTLPTTKAVRGTFSHSSHHNKNKQAGKIIPESDLFPTSRSDVIITTPQQKAVAEEKAKLLREASVVDSDNNNNDDMWSSLLGNKKENYNLMLHKNGKLTEQEVSRLKHAREAAIKESTLNRQIHPEESKS